jgi:hypothetical protein
MVYISAQEITILDGASCVAGKRNPCGLFPKPPSLVKTPKLPLFFVAQKTTFKPLEVDGKF